MKIFKNSHGFTLVEIVVVIGIMAFLTTIIYTSLSGSKAQNRDQKRAGDMSTIQLALEMYFSKNKEYPSRLWPQSKAPDGTVYASDPGSFTYLSTANNISFKKIDPPTVNAWDGYFYVPLGGSKCSSYQLWTRMEVKNPAIDTKKGFDSTSASICGTSDYTAIYPTINASSTANSLVFDVKP